MEQSLVFSRRDAGLFPALGGVANSPGKLYDCNITSVCDVAGGAVLARWTNEMSLLIILMHTCSCSLSFDL